MSNICVTWSVNESKLFHLISKQRNSDLFPVLDGKNGYASYTERCLQHGAIPLQVICKSNSD